MRSRSRTPTATSIVGIKVRVGAHASGRSGTVPLDVALQVADEVGLPLMAHIDHPPPTYEEVIERLRPGDVLTHAFRPFPNAPVTAQGTIKRAVLEARERGVLFDIGHGKGSFAFKTARAMLANGFLPDTISSDVHALCINGPAFDQVTTLSKFLCLGMPLSDVIAASTVNAAFALKRPELGSLKPGCVGDATVLSVKDGQFDYVDVIGEHLDGRSSDRVGGRGDRRTLVAPEGWELDLERVWIVRRPGLAGERARDKLQGHERLARKRGRERLRGGGREPEARVVARVAKHDDRRDVELARGIDARFDQARADSLALEFRKDGEGGKRDRTEGMPFHARGQPARA